jgi:hypothetical protein
VQYFGKIDERLEQQLNPYSIFSKVFLKHLSIKIYDTDVLKNRFFNRWSSALVAKDDSICGRNPPPVVAAPLLFTRSVCVIASHSAD